MESPDGYLFRVAINLVRRRPKRGELSILSLDESTVQVGTPESERAEMREDIRQALRQLPEGQRQVLVLCDWLGLDATTAAAVTGIAASSVRSRLHRARRNLRGELSRRDFQGG